MNVALILALALVISGIQSPRGSVRRDFPVTLGVPVFTGILAFDGVLSRFDGVLMMGVFVAWFVATIVDARKQRSVVEGQSAGKRGWLAVLFCASGLVFLVAAGNLIVIGAKGIAISFGIGEFIIGATVVAVGTSMPELATTLIAKLRGHDEIGLGTILGSNIFNGVFIVSLAAIICPIIVSWRKVAVTLALGMVAVLISYPTRTGYIGRKRGVILLILYAAYLAIILQH